MFARLSPHFCPYARFLTFPLYKSLKNYSFVGNWGEINGYFSLSPPSPGICDVDEAPPPVPPLRPPRQAAAPDLDELGIRQQLGIGLPIIFQNNRKKRIGGALWWFFLKTPAKSCTILLVFQSGFHFSQQKSSLALTFYNEGLFFARFLLE